jgi:sugar phosphate isomerase/epimerase
MADSKDLSRRDFLIGSAAAVGAGSMLTGCAGRKACVCPRDKVQWKLGLDTYMLHRSLTAKDPALRRDFFSMLDMLDEHGLDGVQIDPSHFPGDDAATLERIRSIVEPKGLYVEFGMGGWDPTRMEQRIKLTSQFGGRALRTFFSGENAKWEQLKEWMNYAEQPFKQIGDVAAKHNVWVAIENHGDFTGPQLRDFLERVNHPRVGACFDTGNSLWRKEDPIECAKALAPYAFSMHLKDWTMTFDAEDKPHWTENLLDTGQIPVTKVLKIVAAEQPELYVAMESPAAPGKNEKETVEREWKNFVACAKAADRIFKDLNLR